MDERDCENSFTVVENNLDMTALLSQIPNSYSLLLSGALLLTGCIVFYRYGTGKVNKICFSVVTFLYIILFATYKVADYFTGNGIDQATIIQLKFGLKGAAFGAYKPLVAITSGVLLISLILLALFVFKTQAKKKSGGLLKGLLAYVLLFVAVVVNPALINIYNLPVGTFIPSRASSDSTVAEFYKYYKNPLLQSISKEHKNLVFIYAESLEQAFFNEDVFPDLVPRLKAVGKKSLNFSNMHMAPGTGGTVWAISASMCGLPLFLPNISILNQGSKEFLPNATCLGDMLKDEGYYLTYYGGASLEFTGKGRFFKSHGFDGVFGKNELIPLLEDQEYLNFWGLYDDSLFDITYKRFLELSEKDEKFGLVMLTVDTHSPGYSSKSCDDLSYKDGSSKHLNSIVCADYLINEFINKIVESPYASQTVIVLASDHLNWNDAPAADLLKKARSGRKNIFMIIEPGVDNVEEITTRGTAYDIGPTLLPFLGYSGQIGLGRDLIEKNDESTQKERAYIQSRLYPWKSEILKFWGQPRIRKSISVDIAAKKILIDRKEYKVPIFIELTSGFETALLFGFNNGLDKHLGQMESTIKYLMVGECQYIKVIDDRLSTDEGTPIAGDGLCIITGNKDRYFFKEKLERNTSYNMSELRTMLEMETISVTSL